MRALLSPRGGWLSSIRYLILASLIAIFFTYLLRSQSHTSLPYRTPLGPGWGSSSRPQGPLPPYESHPEIEVHPIDQLIRQAQQKQKETRAKQPNSVGEAAAFYRKRRGRHPPPGFDLWYEGAKSRNALIVEEFFDRIYHDLSPFWALKARDIRIQANTYIQVVRVRDHEASYETDDMNRVPWIQLWHGLIAEAAPFLPDVDMPINYMDETRILVPWDEISKYVAVDMSKRIILPPDEVISTYPGLRLLDRITGPPYDPNWVHNDANKYWDHARMSCPLDSPSRNVSALEDFEDPIDFPVGWPSYSYHGYISNWTQAMDPCYQPHLRSMHGTFIEPVSMATTHELIPLFGGSKLPMNNDILLPGAMYLSEEARYSGGELAKYNWGSKTDTAVWRGVASGGRNKASNWHHFQRHRFVQATNGTTVSLIEQKKFKPQTFEIPPPGLYDIPAQRTGTLGEWLSSFSDAAFIHLECFPAEYAGKAKSAGCSYTDPYFSVMPSMTMADQFASKYLPDIDGNSFSGRWRGFLLSTSLPMKATIYAEWHDDRLMPWVHFVPFDNSFQDFYGIMSYFLNGHDLGARRIAEEGRSWAESALRREDMLLYVWRLLLEFARMCDDNRDRLGYVGDLVGIL
jgi:Glycosyl transferase family 90